MNINIRGEPNIVVAKRGCSQHSDTETMRAQRIDCVARVNTDTLIQEYFPNYLRDRETWMKRPGWNAEYSRHLPDLRLRCLVVLAWFATGAIEKISDEEVEAIPITTRTNALEAELLHRMKYLTGRHEGRPGPYRRHFDHTQESLPDWEVRPGCGLRLLFDAMRYKTDQFGGDYVEIQSLAGFPGREITPCVGGDYIEWKSVSIYFVELHHEDREAGASNHENQFTAMTREWVRSKLKEEQLTVIEDFDRPSNVHDLRRYQRRSRGRIPQRAGRGMVYFMRDPFLPSLDGFAYDILVRREREGPWAGRDAYEHRRRCERRQRQLQKIKQWQDWEGAGKVYIDVPGYDRIFLWDRQGPGLPVVIKRETFATLRQELAKPRSPGVAGKRGLELAIARFRYGIPDLRWKELTSGRLRWRFTKVRHPQENP